VVHWRRWAGVTANQSTLGDQKYIIFFLDFLFFYFSLFFGGKIEFSQSDLLIPFQSDENLIKIFD
jgi:hypothetical protein